MSYKLFRTPEAGEAVAVFVDPAEGGDYSAMSAISKKYLDVFMVYHSKTGETDNDIGSSILGNEASKMGKFIHSHTKKYPWIAVERNVGQATISRLLELEYPRIWRMKSFDLMDQKEEERFGWTTNKKTRPKMLDEWAEALLKREVIVYDENIIKEHMAFIRPDKRPTHPEALSGKHDDLVIACAGAWQVVQSISSENLTKAKVSNMWDNSFGSMYR